MFLVDKKKKILSLLLGAIFLLSIAHSFYYRIRVSVDALAYDQTAWNIVLGNGYIEDARNVFTPAKDNAIARVGPGYQFFLAVVYFFFGHRVWVVWIMQAFLRAATAYLLYLIALRIFVQEERRDHIAFLAVVLFGCMPDLIVLGSMLLTETLAIFLAALSLLVLLRYLDYPTARTMGIFAVVITATFLTRTTFVVLVPTVFIYLIFKRQWLHAVVLAGVVIIMVTPWALHNKKVFGEAILTNLAGGYNLWVGNNPDATGGFVKSPEIQEIRNTHHITEVNTIGLQKYKEFLTHHPVAFLQLQVRKASIYFSLLRPTGFWPYLNKRPLDQVFVVGASLMWSGFLLIFGSAGFWLMLRRYMHDIKIGLLTFFVVLQPASLIPIIVESRYRVSVFLFLSLGAAYAIFQQAPNKKKIYLSVVVFFLFTTIGDLILNWGEFLDRLPFLLS